MEHFGFLVKENSCGKESLIASPIQQSDQKSVVFPLWGLHDARPWNLSKSFERIKMPKRGGELG